MREVPEVELLARIALENPWWEAGSIDSTIRAVEPRAYLARFLRLAKMRLPRRALLLMGPRRVGKTWMIYHTIQRLLDDGASPKGLCYINVQTPLYNGLSLERMLALARKAAGVERGEEFFICFDEIQYLRDWELHLKVLVDSEPSVKFLASGSAAAALKLKSTESGAGRFTDFLLPPLTFYEFLALQGEGGLVRVFPQEGHGASFDYDDENLPQLNKRFIDYINYGGYPEVVFSKEMQADPGRFVRGDIIDKVLMKDLPGLYGIQDVQELNNLFQTLTYNTADEVSLDGLSRKSGVSKNTIKRYIQYLESAFLLKTIHRVDRSAKRFQRATAFKVYVTNPSLYCALFSPVTEDHDHIGALVETAVFAQWFHSPDPQIYYARWKEAEVDIVSVLPDLSPRWAVEVKWSDRYWERPSELGGLRDFCRGHSGCRAIVTSRSVSGHKECDGVKFEFHPSSLYAYVIGYHLIHSRSDLQTGA